MGTLGVVMVLSGLCFLPSCLSRVYIFVPVLKTWLDAQSYCRSRYTDLAVVETKQELLELNQLIGSKTNVWIGLYPNAGLWTWSLAIKNYYLGPNFQVWLPGNPHIGPEFYKVCVALTKTGYWVDLDCSLTYDFLCYNGTGATPLASTDLILVNESMNWTDAQSYCRLHFTDLTSVRNMTENKLVTTLLQGSYTWFGFYRKSWIWSDGSAWSVTNWDPGRAPTSTYSDACVVSNKGLWTNINCTSQQNFTCFVGTRRQVVKVVLRKTDSSLDAEQLTENILQRLIQQVKKQNLNEDIKLTWQKQPTGRVFKKGIPEKSDASCSVAFN